MKLLISGGHLAPSLAVIDEIKAKKKQNVKLFYVGRRFTESKSKLPSLEYKEVKTRSIPFYNLNAGRFNRLFTFSAFVQILKIPMGFINALRIIQKVKPDAIMSFGSYIGMPVAVVGGLLRIPVYIHEQTIYPGFANRLSGPFAKAIFISFPQTRSLFSKKKKVIVTGNPVRPQIFKVIKKPFTIRRTKPVIYITGGSLGSHSINVHIEQIISQLLEDYIVIHQTGNVKQYGDFERITKLREELPDDKKNRYFVVSHFSTDEIGYIYSLCDLVVGRAGANTFFEMVALKKPTLFIPLPWSGHNEQRKQAELFAKKGTGEVFEQTGLSEDLLLNIHTMIANKEDYIKHFTNFEKTYFENAAQNIVSALFP